MTLKEKLFSIKNNNKKAFTLIELLAVIIILAIILIIAIPAIGNIIKNSKQGSFNADVKMMEKAAKTYMSKAGDTSLNEIVIPLQTLIKKNYISKIVSPDNTSKECDGAVIAIKVSKNYNYKGYLNCGNYVSEDIDEIYKQLDRTVEKAAIDALKGNVNLLPEENGTATIPIISLSLGVEDPMDPDNNTISGNIIVNNGTKIENKGTSAAINGGIYEIISDIVVKDEDNASIYIDGKVVVGDSNVENPGEEENKAAAPELASNMIPIMRYNGGWVKADQSNIDETYKWYDYDDKIWANAVTVTSTKLSTYQDAAVGTTVSSSDVLTYLVWIPRYSYYIPTSGTTTPSEIQIKFENKTAAKETGDAKTTYLTHPAFTFGNKELNGFWAGKFELTGTISAITVKPATSLRNQTVSSFYTAISSMKDSGNEYSFNSTEVDTHMIKNSEWGAMAYLSHSKYGLNSEIYKNNSGSTSYYTGRSGGNVGGSQVLANGSEYNSAGYYRYDGGCAVKLADVPGIDANCTTVTNTVSDLSLAYNASTTGNIYGVYDMSGGSSEYVMTNLNYYSGYSSTSNSGFNGLIYGAADYTDGIDFPDEKYFNLYTEKPIATACNGGICYGDALSETAGWYGDFTGMITERYPWLLRGGYSTNTTVAGSFNFSFSDGKAGSIYSSRLIVTLND